MFHRKIQTNIYPHILWKNLSTAQYILPGRSFYDDVFPGSEFIYIFHQYPVTYRRMHRILPAS